MAINPRFSVRDSEEELRRLDESIKLLGYKDRADWFRDMKRKTFELSKNIVSHETINTGNNK